MLCPVQAKSWKARELEKQNIDHRLDMRWEMGVKVIQTRRKDTLEGKRTADALSDFAYWNWTSTFNFYFWLNNCLSSSILMQSRHFSYLHPNCASSLFTLTSLLHPTLYQALWLLVIRLYSFIHSFTGVWLTESYLWEAFLFQLDCPGRIAFFIKGYWRHCLFI